MAITTLFLTGVEISARMYRGLITDLFGEGIRNVAGNEFKVIPRAAGANMTVTVLKGTGPDAVAYITGDDVTGQGTYRSAMDADFPDLGIAAAPASGTRSDLIVLEIVDSQVVGGTTNLARLRVLTGVASLTTEKTAIPLARISVPTGATSIQAANITDLRAGATGGGATVRTASEVLTQTQIDALTTTQKYAGRLIENSTVGRLQHVPSAGATPVDIAVPSVAGAASLAGSSVTTSWTTQQFFLGVAYSEAQFMVSAKNGYGFLGWAATSAANSHGISFVNGTPQTFHPASSTDPSLPFSMLDNNSTPQTINLYIRNVIYNATTGYLSFEWQLLSGAFTLNAATRLTWRAR